MGLGKNLGRIFTRLERFSWGGEIVARHEIKKDVIVTELANPFGAHLSVGTVDRDAAHLSPRDAAKLARVLDQIVQKSEVGEKR